MSVWSTISGQVMFSKDDHGCSLKTLFNDLYDDNSSKISQLNQREYKFEYTYSLENESAWEVVQKFVSEIKKFDKKAQLDMGVNIRYIV